MLLGFARRARQSAQLLVAVTLFGMVLAGAASAQSRQPNWPEYMTIGTGSAGGTYSVYGEALARLLTRQLDLQVLTRPTEGPAENIRLIEAGEVQLGFVTLGIAQQAWNATAEWTKGQQFRSMRAIFPMYDTPFQFLVRQDSGALRIADFAGKRIGIGPAGGTGGIYTPQILKTLGISATLLTGSWTDLAVQLTGGRLDAMVAVAGVPLPEVIELDRKGLVRSLALTPPETVALRLAIPELAPSLIAAGIYPSLRRHYQTVGIFNFAVANAGLPDDLVYAILDAVFTYQDELVQAHGAAAETVPANFTRNTVIPFHPGAARWFNNKAVAGVVRGD